MTTQAERLAALERGLSDHESRCEERLVDIKTTVQDTQEAIDKLQRWLVGLIVAIAGGALTSLAGIVFRAVGLA